MEIKQAFQLIEDELSKAKAVLEKKAEIEASLGKREDAVRDLEKNVEERAKKYVISPQDAEDRYNDAVRMKKEISNREEVVSKRENEVISKEREAENILENAKARMKDVEIEKEMIRDRELRVIESQRIVAEKMKKLNLYE